VIKLCLEEKIYEHPISARCWIINDHDPITILEVLSHTAVRFNVHANSNIYKVVPIAELDLSVKKIEK
jgi:hypothetical protein